MILIRSMLILTVFTSCINSKVKYSGDEKSTTSTTLPEVNRSNGVAATGQTLYNQHCAGCHGSSGTGGNGPDITEAGDLTLTQFIINGSDTPGYTMPNNSTYQLNIPEDIEHISAYIGNDFQP